jgi:hypothetical protein
MVTEASYTQLIIRELHLKGVLGTFELELRIAFDNFRIKIPNKNVYASERSATFLAITSYTF